MGIQSEAEEIIYNIRRRLAAHVGSNAQSSRRLKEVFAEIDRNGNNRIDRNEFKHAFTILGIELSSRDIDLIFDHFDSDGSNDFNYREFLELLDIPVGEQQVSEEVMKITDEICASIRLSIEDRFGCGFKRDMTVLDFFEEADERKTGRIYRKELIYLLNDRLRIQPEISMRDIDYLFERFDGNRNSTTMEYHSFVNIILDREKEHSLEKIMITQTNEIIDLITQQLLEAFGDRDSIRHRLSHVFHDYDRKDRISRKDLIAIILDELRIEGLRVREIEYLFDRFDRTGAGVIDYRELMDLLATGTNPRSPVGKKASMSVNQIMEAIRKALIDELGADLNVASRMKEVFAAIDRNGNSRLERSELQQAMEALKLELLPSEIQLLMQRFDHDDSGNFDYMEFMELIAPARK